MRSDRIEVADDGSPLGTLVVPGCEPLKPKPAAARVAEAKAELARAEAQSITGEADPDQGAVALFEGYSDPAKRDAAKALYVVRQLPAAEVAKSVGVPVETVAQWVHEGRWNRIVAKTLSVLSGDEGAKLTRFRIENRERLLRQQVLDAEAQQTVLREQIASGEMKVTKSSAEALGALARVQNAAMGVAESGAVVDAGETEEKKAEKRGNSPLVVIYRESASGIPTLGKRKETVEVVEVKG